jgi:hypothetical protein
VNAPERINALKARGWSVSVRVIRYDSSGIPVMRGRDGRYPGRIDPRGGVVLVEIDDGDGIIRRAESRCFPGGTNAKGKDTPGDQFNRRYGLSMALGRAIQKSRGATAVIRDAEA